MAKNHVTVDTPPAERMEWLEERIAHLESKLACARSVLASEKLALTLNPEQRALLFEMDEQAGENIAAELTQKRLSLKRELPDAASIIDTVFEEE